MLCHGRLSRAAYARPASISSEKMDFLAEVSVATRPAPSVSVARSLTTSPLPTSPSSLNSPHTSFMRFMHAAAAQLGLIQDECKDTLHLNCWRFLVSTLDRSRSLEKVSSGSVLKHWRSFGRMFSSTSRRTNNFKSTKIVVVVESPAKAKTVQRILGSDFIVLPSHGHVRDLAARAGSVRPENDYAMLWEVPEAAQPHLTRIKNALKSANRLVLATDPDREGETIAWHVVEVLKAEGLLRKRKEGLKKSKTVSVGRVLWKEITKSVVLHSMQGPLNTRIQPTLVNAYLAGRALDHLVSFSLSPFLWRKFPGCQSAGRVHLAALQLVCEREKAVKEFVPRESWTLEVYGCFEDAGMPFSLTTVLMDGEFLDMAKHIALAKKLNNSALKVLKVTKEFKQRVSPEPYTTSTLQEDAQARLGFEAEMTMTLARKLYEGVDLGKGEVTGLITYPCTTGFKLSKMAALLNVRALISKRLGNEYIPQMAVEFESKVTNPFEVHEAIRPTNVQRLPSVLCDTLEKDALALYTLIWKRTVQCQMESAMYEEVSVDFVTEAEAVSLQATATYLTFPGFFAASMVDETSSSSKATSLSDHSDHQDAASKSWDILSALKEGDILHIEKVEAQQHFTSVPARYTEGQLVKALAESGIGRPSAYASILKSLQAKKYVRVENQQIIPEVQGLMVMAFFSHYLSGFVDCNITALLEKQLDAVSGGYLHWKKVLRDYWPAFNEAVSSAMKISEKEVAKVLHEAFFTQGFTDLGCKGRLCPRCGTGKLLLKKSRLGRGYYLTCSGHPLCSFKARVLGDEVANAKADTTMVPSERITSIFLGVDPATNLEVRVRSGPWGSYIELGGSEKGLECFKLPQGVKPEDITLQDALQLMKYPLELGKHPEDGHAVILGLNNKSYVVKHQFTTAVLSKNENVKEMTLERALKLLKGVRSGRSKLSAEKKARKTKKTDSTVKQGNLL